MPGGHRLVAAVCGLSLAVCAGCAGVGVAGPQEDAGPDVRLTPASEFYPWDGGVGLFGPCTNDHDCLYATGVQCLTTFPGGLCSSRCDLSSDCGPEGTCVQNVCFPSCTAANGNCAGIGAMCDFAGPYCVPSCGGGAPPCAGGTVCDPYSVACTASPATGAADNGAPCASDDQCLGFCITDGVPIEDTVGLPLGYLGGMCASYARAPDPGALVDGGPLPTSNCPDGSVIVPPFSMAGEMIACIQACHGDGDCRAGYACRATDGTITYSDGYCAPIDCADGVHQCPPPSTCRPPLTVPGPGWCAK